MYKITNNTILGSQLIVQLTPIVKNEQKVFISNKVYCL
jgi:hypothetical protein